MTKLIIGIVAALLVAGLATPAFAHDGHNHSEPLREKLSEATSRTQQAVQETHESVKSARDELKEKRSEIKDLLKEHKTQIQARRAELKQKIETTRTERKTELVEKRLELCQERQVKINQLVASSAKIGRERLARIQKVESNVKDFYNRQALTSSEYLAATALVDEKEAIAIAAVEVAESQQFDCTKVDGDNPSGELKTLRVARHDALNNYRDSTKQLIQIVKAAFKAKSSEGSSS